MRLMAAASARARVTRGLAWKGVSTVATQGTRIVVGIGLAHLLSPHDYGVAGMVVVFSSLVYVFSDLAFGAALVQRAELTEADRSTVFWTSAGVGFLLMLVGIGSAHPLAAFYGEPAVSGLVMAMSTTFLLAAVTSTQTALLTREMNFRSLELRQIGATIVSGVVGLGLASAGYGPWAIIGQQIGAIAASTALLWVASPWRPKLTFSFASLRSLAGYSGNVFGARILFFLNRNADNLLIGRFLGASALGAYSVAYNVMLMPFAQIATPVQDVLFPAFARMQDDVRALGAAWLRANRAVAAITIPTLLGVMVMADELVRVMLGNRWEATARVLQVLAWVGLLQSLQGLNGTVLRSVDRTNLLFRYSVVVVSVSLVAFVVGLHWGVVGVAVSFAISSTLVEPYYSYLTARAVGLTLRDFAGALSGVAQAAMLMAVLVLATRIALLHAGAPAFVRLVVCVVGGALVYVPLCYWRAPEIVDEVRAFLPAGRRRVVPVSAEATT